MQMQYNDCEKCIYNSLKDAECDKLRRFAGGFYYCAKFRKKLELKTQGEGGQNIVRTQKRWNTESETQ